MPFELPELPYAKDALAPHISAETIDYHYGKHHKAYVDNLNKLVVGSDFDGQSLTDIIINASGPIFNNAAQVWNHSFYWNCLAPNPESKVRAPSGQLAAAIDLKFGSFDKFKEDFSKSAATRFGSGWAWLVKTSSGDLVIKSTANAQTPLTEGDKPLLTCDVWEHAYYIDYRNARPKYIEKFWDIVNWDFVAEQFL